MGSGGADGLAVKVETAQAPRAVPDGVVAVEMAAHKHAEAGTGAAAGLFARLTACRRGAQDGSGSHFACRGRPGRGRCPDASKPSAGIAEGTR